ncbi:hypothetical protein [Plastoroseomonas arctica]|uniref:Uncharacterized protein n=1 Tax=Plastoroseomonas arctica TaxID=1509237 RepID=A0AAF1K489_9PROT|nr:hypothetical protein [Plastoroseomonas arctica]MBR0656433.1 hypothetical protein [Plastoroseomonas arctica]
MDMFESVAGRGCPLWPSSASAATSKRPAIAEAEINPLVVHERDLTVADAWLTRA